jgi:ribonuclease-3
MRMAEDLEPLECRLQHRFADRELLIRALRHRSRAYEEGETDNNERLEFLGDAVLGFLVSEHLLTQFPRASEGQLSKWKARVVSASRLYEVAVELGIGDFIGLGRGEELSGGRSKRALLADAVEAIIAAVYLDGGIEAARALVLGTIMRGFDAEAGPAPSDPKTTLQELAHLLKLPPPRYLTVAEKGPGHAKIFTVEVRLGRDFIASAEGASKKAAGQTAAALMIARLSSRSSEPALIQQYQ